MVKNPPANAGDMGSIPGSLGLEDPLKEEMSTHSSIFAMDRGAWQTTIHGMQLSNWTLSACAYNLKILSKSVYKVNDIFNTSAIFLN